MILPERSEFNALLRAYRQFSKSKWLEHFLNASQDGDHYEVGDSKRAFYVSDGELYWADTDEPVHLEELEDENLYRRSDFQTFSDAYDYLLAKKGELFYIYPDRSTVDVHQATLDMTFTFEQICDIEFFYREKM